MTPYKERRNIITLLKQVFMMKEGKIVYQRSEFKKKITILMINCNSLHF